MTREIEYQGGKISEPISEREIRVLRCVQLFQTSETEWPRDMPRLEALGLVDRSPYPAGLGPLAGAHVRRLTDAGKSIVEAMYNGR